MVDDAFAPDEAKGRIVAARKDGGILHGYVALIKIAIKRPRLHLTACEFAFVHQQVKRVLMVVAFFADGVEALDEFAFREKMLFRCGGHNPCLFTTAPRS